MVSVLGAERDASDSVDHDMKSQLVLFFPRIAQKSKRDVWGLD